MRAALCCAAALLLPLVAGAEESRWEMSLTHHLGGAAAGSEKAVITLDGESRTRTVASKVEMTAMGTRLQLDTLLRVADPSGAVIDYRIEALVAGQTQRNVMTRHGAKVRFQVEAGGQEIAREADAPEPMVLLDNMVGAHQGLMVARFGEQAAEGAEFQVVVPQALASVPGVLTARKGERGLFGGDPVAVDVYELTVGGVVTTIRASDEVPGLFLELEVPLQQYRIVRDGFERGVGPDPEPEGPSGIVSQEVTVGSGELALGATLTLPEKLEGKVAGIVLVHGSGPNDRDETIAGVNRPFRDIAEGLSASGFAVLRYDKRTHALQGKVSMERLVALASTLEGEVVDDAVTAAQLLRDRPEVDPKRVFVLGHSLGGMALPYILKRVEWAAGGIALAGSARPLDRLVVEQSRYLMGERGSPAAEIDTAIAELEAGFARIRSGEAPDGEGFLGATAGYWRDILFREPAREIAAKPHPVLFLFGAKDYQVTSREMEAWRTACAEAGKENAAFKVFADLNHLFMRVEGTSDGTEYQRPGHVAPEVIEEIVVWLGEQGG